MHIILEPSAVQTQDSQVQRRPHHPVKQAQLKQKILFWKLKQVSEFLLQLRRILRPRRGSFQTSASTLAKSTLAQVISTPPASTPMTGFSKKNSGKYEDPQGRGMKRISSSANQHTFRSRMSLSPLDPYQYTRLSFIEHFSVPERYRMVIYR